MSNKCYIYEPHFNTNCFRVSMNEQLEDINYIIVTCSPSYNGVYKWNKPLIRSKDELGVWTNGKLPCYTVPIYLCTKIKDLSELVNPDVIKIVKKQQKDWAEGKVKGKAPHKRGKQPWMIY